MPPRGVDEFVYESSPITGQVDVEFDIGPSCYNFVDVRYFGEPVLRERIIEARLNVTYISNTVNVTNITYANSVVYNYGPDYNMLSQYSTRPIRRMTLEREANVDLSVAAKSKALTKVEGDRLVVAAPLTLQKPSAPTAPKTVKEKIAKPAIERGWSDVHDPKAQAELKQKMKSEDPKNIPPPSIKPRDKAEAVQSSPATPASGKMPAMAPSSAASAHPAATTAPKTIESPAMTPDKGKGREKHLKDVSPMPTAAAPVNPASPPPPMTPPGKSKKERFAKPPPGLGPSSSGVPGTAPAPAPNKPSELRRDAASSLATSPDGTPFREAPGRNKEAGKGKRAEKAPDLMPPVRQPSEPQVERAPRKPKNEPPFTPPIRQVPPDMQPRRPVPPERVAPPSREVPPEAPRKHPLPPERTAPPAPGPAANAPARPPKPEAPPDKRGPGKKGAEPVPSPGP